MPGEYKILFSSDLIVRLCLGPVLCPIRQESSNEVWYNVQYSILFDTKMKTTVLFVTYQRAAECKIFFCHNSEPSVPVVLAIKQALFDTHIFRSL